MVIDKASKVHQRRTLIDSVYVPRLSLVVMNMQSLDDVAMP